MENGNELYSKIIQSAKFVADNATFVKINDEAISKFLNGLKKSDYENTISVKGNGPLKFSSLEEEVKFFSSNKLDKFWKRF